MSKTGIQLYTLRDVDEPLPTLLERVADAGYDGVEFAYRVPDADVGDVHDTLDRTGLTSIAGHVVVDRLQEDMSSVVDLYAALDCERIVIPVLDESYFVSNEAVQETAATLEGLAERLADRGFELLLHVHGTEFADLDGRTGFEALMAETETVQLELDLGWVVDAGQDPVTLLERYGDRTPLVHVADVDLATGESTEVGDGSVELGRAVRAARDSGVEWFVYEHDRPADPLASLAHGAEVLERYLD